MTTPPEKPSIYVPGPYDTPRTGQFTTRPAPIAPTPPASSRRAWIVAGVVASAAVLTLVALTAVVVWSIRSPAAAPVTASAPTTRAPQVAAGATAPPRTFEDADELVMWLNALGLTCGEVDHVDGPTIATSMIDCGKTVVAAVYEDHPHALRAFDALVAISPSTGVHMAIGPNWTVSSDDAWYAQRAARLLGGEYKTS